MLGTLLAHVQHAIDLAPATIAPAHACPRATCGAADPEGVKPVSQTAFAQRWRWLIQKNLFFQPFAVNFGGIGERLLSAAP